MQDDLLSLLCCPVSKKPLEIASEELIESLNKSIPEGKIANIGGTVITENLTSGLYEPVAGLLYPVIDDIPLLVHDNAIKVK